MPTFLLLFLRVASPTAALVAAVAGIVGPSLDSEGRLTSYGWGALIGLFNSTILAIGLTVFEHLKEREDEAQELQRLGDSIAAQSKILASQEQLLHTQSALLTKQDQALVDLRRQFFRIESVDLMVEFWIPSDLPQLQVYRNRLDQFLAQWERDGRPKPDPTTRIGIQPASGADAAQHPVYALSIRGESNLLPQQGSDSERWAFVALSPTADVVITDRPDFTYLDRLPSLLHYKGALHAHCDLKYLLPTIYKTKRKISRTTILSYYPGKGQFRVLARKQNAYTIHNSGRVLSFEDVKGKFLAVVIGGPFGLGGTQKTIEVGEVRVNFKRGKGMDYSSYVSLQRNQLQRIEGKNWYAYIHHVQHGLRV